MISIDELRDIKDVTTLYKVGTKIMPDNKEEMESYLIQRFEDLGYYGMYPLWIIPVINILGKNFRYRYLIVEVNGDRVAIFYKYVFVLKTKYMRLFFKPFSLSRNTENEQIVMDTLNDNKLIRHIFKSSDVPINKADDLDFFNIITERWEKINKSEWRSTKRVNLANKSGKFTCRDITREDVPALLTVFNLWATHKKIYKGSPMNSTLAEIELFIKLVQEGKMRCIGVFYNGRMVSYAGLVECFNKRIGHQWYNTNITNVAIAELLETFPELDDGIYQTLHRNLGAITHYYLTKRYLDDGIEAVYMAGPGDEPFLLSHKQEINSRVIVYKNELVPGVGNGYIKE